MGDIPMHMVEQLRSICEVLPDAYEQDAWAGIRFRIRGRTFVHLVAIQDGRPAAMSRHCGTRGPAVVMTFESQGEELLALRCAGPPFWLPPWRESTVGLFVDAGSDWEEIRELVTESYCVQAPAKFARLLRSPPS